MPYTTRLENGKYLVINDNGSLTILRNGEKWPAADDLKHVKLVLCLAQRVEQLETALGELRHGSLDEFGKHRVDGMGQFLAYPPQPAVVRNWNEIVTKALDDAA